MTSDLISYKETVEEVLASNPYARSDDKVLTFLVWRRLKPIAIPFEVLKDLPMPETLSRIRRKIQNEEKRFLPSADVLEKRGSRVEEVKSWATLN